MTWMIFINVHGPSRRTVPRKVYSAPNRNKYQKQEYVSEEKIEVDA
jgi:hypothetical protein